jgi:hypothetical protein
MTVSHGDSSMVFAADAPGWILEATRVIPLSPDV